DFPELQEKELLELVVTWLGMCWPGNPFIIGVEVLCEESWSNHGHVEIAEGTVAVYQQCDTIEELRRENLQADMGLSEIVWNLAILKASVPTKVCSINEHAGSLPSTTPDGRHRANHRKEPLLSQVMLPGRDFDTRVKGSRWLVNPSSGYELRRMR
ncbi:unnamed protein product, partial [Prorocentrum cordatum]